jgi:hypothetical protein
MEIRRFDHPDRYSPASSELRIADCTHFVLHSFIQLIQFFVLSWSKSYFVAGLTSGITGTVVGILYSSNSKIDVYIPMIIFVKFDRSLRKKCCEDGSIPIPRVRQRVFDAESGKYYMVTKFTLLLAF